MFGHSLLLALAWMSGASPAAARLDRIRGEIGVAVAELRKKLAQPDPVVTTRDLSNGALAILESAGSVLEAERWLSRVLDAQDHRPEGAGVGSLPWEVGRDRVQDENAIEFGTAAWGPILLRYGEHLSPAFKARLVNHVAPAIVALERHTSDASPKKVEVSYTNIFLMNTVNLLLLAQAVDDPATLAVAQEQLARWVQEAWLHGVHEYDSPTYYAADLNSLTVGYALVKEAKAKARLAWALDLLWTDIAANYFAPRNSLSGAHSRDYDFLSGSGGIDVYLAAEGWSDALPPKLDVEFIHLLLGEELEGAYHPAAAIRALSLVPERLVTSTFGSPDRGPNERINYLTPEASVSSVSADFGPQDKLIAWELAGPKGPVVSLVADTLDAPYGKEKIEGQDGHRKPRHLPLHPAVAQDRGAMLVLLDLDPSHEKEVASLATSLVFPTAGTTASVDGSPIELSVPAQTQFGLGSTLLLNRASACAAFRLVDAEGAGGQAAKLSLITDREGLRWGAGRLTAQAYRGPERQLPEKHLRFALLSLVDSCPDGARAQALAKQVALAKVETDVPPAEGHGPRVWTVRAQLPGHAELEVSRDLSKRRVLAGRSVGWS